MIPPECPEENQNQGVLPAIKNTCVVYDKRDDETFCSPVSGAMEQSDAWRTGEGRFALHALAEEVGLSIAFLAQRS